MKWISKKEKKMQDIYYLKSKSLESWVYIDFDGSYWVARMITKQCNLNTMITDEEKKNAMYFSKSEEGRVQIERKSLIDDGFQKENSSTNLTLPNLTSPNFKLCGF